MSKHSIEPDKEHEKPATLASDVEPPAFGDAAVEAPLVEEPAIEAPEIAAPAAGDGNCFASDFWEHEADKARAGTETGASGAGTALGLQAYRENVRVGTESQIADDLGERGGDGVRAVVAKIGEEVDDNYREAQRNLTASREVSAAAPAGSEASSPSSGKGAETPTAVHARQGNEPSETRGQSQTARQDGPSPTPKPLPTAGLASESIDYKKLNKMIAGIVGDKKFDVMDCGGSREMAGPADSPGGKAQSARQDNFDPGFFRRKTEA